MNIVYRLAIGPHVRSFSGNFILVFKMSYSVLILFFLSAFVAYLNLCTFYNVFSILSQCFLCRQAVLINLPSSVPPSLHTASYWQMSSIVALAPVNVFIW